MKIIGLLTAWQIVIRIRQATIRIRQQIVANNGQVSWQNWQKSGRKWSIFKEVKIRTLVKQKYNMF